MTADGHTIVIKDQPKKDKAKSEEKESASVKEEAEAAKRNFRMDQAPDKTAELDVEAADKNAASPAKKDGKKDLNAEVNLTN